MYHFNVKVKKCSFEIYGNSVTSYTSLNKDLGTTDDNITLALSIHIIIHLVPYMYSSSFLLKSITIHWCFFCTPQQC